jgi:hypothetical protein
MTKFAGAPEDVQRFCEAEGRDGETPAGAAVTDERLAIDLRLAGR